MVLLKIHTPSTPVSDGEYRLVFVEDMTYSLLVDNELSDPSLAGFMQDLAFINDDNLMESAHTMAHFKQQVNECTNVSVSKEMVLMLQQHYSNSEKSYLEP